MTSAHLSGEDQVLNMKQTYSKSSTLTADRPTLFCLSSGLLGFHLLGPNIESRSSHSQSAVALTIFTHSKHIIEKGVLCELRETRMLKSMATASKVVHAAVLSVGIACQKDK